MLFLILKKVRMVKLTSPQIPTASKNCFPRKKEKRKFPLLLNAIWKTLRVINSPQLKIVPPLFVACLHLMISKPHYISLLLQVPNIWQL